MTQFSDGDTCEKCVHWEKSKDTRFTSSKGACFRFPETIEKSDTTRSCGEFSVRTDPKKKAG